MPTKKQLIKYFYHDIMSHDLGVMTSKTLTDELKAHYQRSMMEYAAEKADEFIKYFKKEGEKDE